MAIDLGSDLIVVRAWLRLTRLGSKQAAYAQKVYYTCHKRKTDVQSFQTRFPSLGDAVFIWKSGTASAATGPADIVVNGTAGDDFILSKDESRAYLALWGCNEIAEIDTPGRMARVVASSPLIEASSAVAWGRGNGDRGSLYISAGNSGTGTAMTGTVARVDIL